MSLPLNEQNLNENDQAERVVATFQGNRAHDLGNIPEDQSDGTMTLSREEREGETKKEAYFELPPALLNDQQRTPSTLLVEPGRVWPEPNSGDDKPASPNCLSWKIVAVLGVLVTVGIIIFLVVYLLLPGGNSSDDSIMPVGPTVAPTDFAVLRDALAQVSGEAALDDPSSPQRQALQWLYTDDPAQVRVVTHGRLALVQRYVLVLLYFALNGETWSDTIARNYLNGQHECSWNGITCGISSRTNRVIRVNLQSANVTGSLPKELGKLAYLQALIMNGNSLTGTIPIKLYQLSVLRQLDLSQNALSGPIKNRIWKLNSITEVNLGQNSLTGDLPEFDVDCIPAILSVDLSDNQLTGTIPTLYGKISLLKSLLLSKNQLSGTIPEDLYMVPTLQRLDVGTNQLSGTLSAQLWKNPSLQVTYFCLNRLEGTIPPVPRLGSQSIRALDLRSNQLNGTIPVSLINHATLQGLYLGNNSLSGPLPELARPADSQLIELHVSRNNLTGTISPTLWDVPQLSDLALYANSFTGTLPPFPSTPMALRYLWTHTNGLNGALPADWSSLPNLGKSRRRDFFREGTTLTPFIQRNWSYMVTVFVLKYPHPYLDWRIWCF